MREKCKIEKEQQTLREKKVKRQKEREAKCRQRTAKRQGNASTSNSKFSPQALGRAVRRANSSLPRSPGKKKAKFCNL